MTKFRKNSWFWGSVIFLIILRFSIVSVIYENPNWAVTLDSQDYLHLAGEILQGIGYQGQSNPGLELNKTPGYPLFIAGVFATIGETIGNISIVQMAISTLTGFLLYKLLIDAVSENTARVGLILYLSEPTTILWSLTIMTEILFTFIITLVIFLLFHWIDKKYHAPLILIGILVGIAAYVRPMGLIVVLVITAWFIAQGIHEIKSNIKGFAKNFLLPGILFYLGFWIITSPWTLHNGNKYDCPTFSTISTKNLRVWMAAKVIAEVEEIPIDAAIEQLRPEKNNNCDLETLKYINILLRNPGPYLKLHLGGTLPILFGNNFDRIVLMIGEGYSPPDLWVPYLEEGLAGVGDILWQETVQRPLLYILFAATLFYQILLITFSVLGILRSFNNNDAALKWWTGLLVAVMVGLLFIPGPVGRERMRVPAIPIIIYFTSIGGMPAVGNFMSKRSKD